MKKETKQNPYAAKAGDKVAGKIAGVILWLQRKWADGMSRNLERLRPGTRKVILVIGVVLMMLYSGYLVAFSFSNNARLITGPASIKIPRTIQESDTTSNPKGAPAFMMPITRFHRYIDSLGTTSPGRRIRDSLLRERPGLLDSITHLEQLWCR